MINDGHTPNWIEWDSEKQCRRSYYEISDGVIAIRTEYFVDDLIDANAERRAAAPKRYGDMAMVASVPMNVYQKFVRPALDQRDDEYVRRMFINNSDYSKFRTRDGKV